MFTCKTGNWTQGVIEMYNYLLTLTLVWKNDLAGIKQEKRHANRTTSQALAYNNTENGMKQVLWVMCEQERCARNGHANSSSLWILQAWNDMFSGMPDYCAVVHTKSLFRIIFLLKHLWSKFKNGNLVQTMSDLYLMIIFARTIRIFFLQVRIIYPWPQVHNENPCRFLNCFLWRSFVNYVVSPFIQRKRQWLGIFEDVSTVQTTREEREL